MLKQQDATNQRRQCDAADAAGAASCSAPRMIFS
jgi:hypothetical protein